jgi:hypothetical protein
LLARVPLLCRLVVRVLVEELRAGGPSREAQGTGVVGDEGPIQVRYVDRDGGSAVPGRGPVRDALHNLASLPHISVAGAVATATHGSGATNGNLATAVAGLELVTSGGEIVEVFRGEPYFDGLVVGLGALGAVTRITLEVEPAYEVRQWVFEGLSWEALFEHFEEIMSCGYSVRSLPAGARRSIRFGSRVA